MRLCLDTDVQIDTVCLPHPSATTAQKRRKKNPNRHTKIALVWNIFIIFFYGRRLWYFTWLWRLSTSQSWHKTFSVSREGLQPIFFHSSLVLVWRKNSLVNVITILAIWRDKKKRAHKKWTLHLNMFGFFRWCYCYCCSSVRQKLPSAHADRIRVVANTTIALFSRSFTPFLSLNFNIFLAKIRCQNSS